MFDVITQNRQLETRKTEITYGIRQVPLSFVCYDVIIYDFGFKKKFEYKHIIFSIL